MLGWKSRVQLKRVTYYFSLNKNVVRGLNISKGDVLFSYLGEDASGRPIVITFLDKKDIKGEEEKKLT